MAPSVGRESTGIYSSMASPKFDLKPLEGKTDFGLWKRRMKALLMQQGVVDALTEKFDTTLSDADKKAIKFKAYSSLILALGDNALIKIGDLSSAKEI